MGSSFLASPSCRLAICSGVCLYCSYSSKNSSSVAKEKLLKITEKMPKNEALDLIDVYKDSVKKQDAARKRNKVDSIGDITSRMLPRKFKARGR